jgi:hypothetical protein
MENMVSNYGHPNCAPCHPYKPSPVTTREFMTALNQIEVKHQNNVEFLKNPYPAIDYDELHKQAGTAQKLVQNLSIVERQGLPSPPSAWKSGSVPVFHLSWLQPGPNRLFYF